MVINFGCPDCGADMAYDIKLGKLRCGHCGHCEDIQEDCDLWKEPKKEFTDGLYCVNCGGELTVNEKNCALHCEYCGTPLVITDRLAGQWRPVYVLPFELDREQAETSFKRWCGSGLFSPRGFKSAKNIQHLQPRYIPYWLYDLDTTVDMEGTATRVRVYTRGETEYTETKFYHVSRRMRLEYRQVPYDASKEMDDTVMKKLEPYRHDELKSFQMPYLAGFQADQGDYSAGELEPQVKERVKSRAFDQVESTISGYTTVSIERQHIQYDRIRSDYAYFPAWFISYRYRDSDFLFAMNGQTGKVIGTPPISRGKVALWFAGMTAVIMAVIMAVLMFMEDVIQLTDVGMGLAFSMIVSGVITGILVHGSGGRMTASADTYLDQGNIHMEHKEDRFVNTIVTKRHKPKPDSGPKGHGRRRH